MSTIVIADQVRIPSWVNDLESFRRWSQTRDYPERGWVSFLNGEIWVDTSMEQLFTHSQVKTEFTVVLGGLMKGEELGYFFSGGYSTSRRRQGELKSKVSGRSFLLETKPDRLGHPQFFLRAS